MQTTHVQRQIACARQQECNKCIAHTDLSTPRAACSVITDTCRRRWAVYDLCHLWWDACKRVYDAPCTMHCRCLSTHAICHNQLLIAGCMNAMWLHCLPARSGLLLIIVFAHARSHMLRRRLYGMQHEVDVGRLCSRSTCLGVLAQQERFHCRAILASRAHYMQACSWPQCMTVRVAMRHRRWTNIRPLRALHHSIQSYIMSSRAILNVGERADDHHRASTT